MILSRNSSQADSYYQLAKSGQIFVANATVTAPVAFGTAAGMGGPLLWNNTGPAAGATGPRVMAVILGLAVGWTTAPAATGEMGITWGSGQASAPSSTTAIDGVACTLPGGAATKPQCNVYRVGTVANAGAAILVTHQVSTTTPAATPVFVPLDGLVQVEPGCWASPAAAIAIATMVANISLVWAEIPF